MSIINTTFGFVFVHVPKSAGTSVTSVLSQLCTVLDVEVGGSQFGESIQTAYQRRHGLSKHSTATEIRALLGGQLWKRYTSFGVVRHPLGRLASAYRFLRQWDSPQNRWRETVSRFETFEEFVASDLWVTDEGPDRMFRPQSFWLAETSRNELVVDEVCRVETLDADLRRLLQGLNVKPTLLPEAVPQLNSTVDRDESAGLPEALLAKIRARYARDLAMFGYTL